jgi:tetratricopeptide (TPR) repeat protein
MDAAIADFDLAVQHDPRNAAAWKVRANAYYNHKRDYKTAINDLGQALRINSRDGNALFNRGLAYRANGEPDRAIIDFDTAIKINPGNADAAEAYYNRGLSYRDLRDYDKAISDFSQAIRLDSKKAFMFVDAAWPLPPRAISIQAIEDFDAARLIRRTRSCSATAAWPIATGLIDSAINDYDQAIGNPNRPRLLQPRLLITTSATMRPRSRLQQGDQNQSELRARLL